MSEPRRIEAPFSRELARLLHAGDRVLVSGTLWVARDAAHARLAGTLGRGGTLPFPPEGAVLYYMGPSPARPGQIIGAAGPTTAARMDVYVRSLLEAGVRGMIGKGERSEEARRAIREHGAVYLAATGGVGALLGSCITFCEIVAYEDLGPEALRRVEVRDLPAIVAIDTSGGDLYTIGRVRWRGERGAG